MSTLHAKLSASGSERWINCPGSVSAEEGLPDKSSIFAAEGTAAHELAELCLKEGINAYDYIGAVLPETNHTVDRTMADYVQVYIDYVVSLGGSQMYEQTISFGDWVEGGFGTSDAIVIVGNTMHVVDLKYGQGVKVYAENNTQAKLYALGAYATFGDISQVDQVIISIVQPRLDHIDVSEPIPTIDLLKFGQFVSTKAQEALADNAKRVPGEKQCQFCKAKATCPELKAYTEKALMTNFENMDDLPPADKLSDEQLQHVLDSKKLIISWLEAVENLIFERLTTGQGFPGYKLVEGRSLREWSDEEVASAVLTELLGEQAYTKKLISVTQAEKVLGKTNSGAIASIINKPSGKPTLAPESDKRPAINITADSFDGF